MNVLEHIRIVLVRTSHPGNIGATARAMKNMGLRDLALVTPKQFPDGLATAMASGADDVLDSASLYPDVAAAIADCQVVVGTSARPRCIEWQTLDARACAKQVLDYLQRNLTNPQDTQHIPRAAIVFGNEQSGLSNDELHLCQQHVIIPTDAAYSSLNLSQAVQIICYELRQAFLVGSTQQEQDIPMLANSEEMESFFHHLDDIMHITGFLNGKQSQGLGARIRRIFNKAQLSRREVNILRGILSAVQIRVLGHGENK